MARVGERLELANVEILPGPEASSLVLRLAWRLRGAGAWGDTLFVHVLDGQGRWVAGADGDALGGLLPLVAWPNGGLVVDERLLSVEGLDPGEYRVTVGAYNRDSGRRYRAVDATGAAIADGEITVATTTLP
ncbi:MAG: hypothetical protein GX649_12880 [Chloroflexi bacterium]|nr:hypothetical protein [Chloroflexota bacterium]